MAFSVKRQNIRRKSFDDFELNGVGGHLGGDFAAKFRDKTAESQIFAAN